MKNKSPYLLLIVFIVLALSPIAVGLVVEWVVW